MRMFIEAPEPSVMRTIGSGLSAYNREFGGGRLDEFVVTLRDDAGVVCGGLTFDLYAGVMHLEWLWIEAAYRRHGHGRALLELAEAEGRRRGAATAHLDTFTFQAPAFYAKCGYTVFGTIDHANGVQRVYLRKSLR